MPLNFPIEKQPMCQEIMQYDKAAKMQNSWRGLPKCDGRVNGEGWVGFAEIQE